MSESYPAGIETIDGVETLYMSRLDRVSFGALDYLHNSDQDLKSMRGNPLTIGGEQGYFWAQSKYDERSGEVMLAVSFEPKDSPEAKEKYLWSVNDDRRREAHAGKTSLKSKLLSKFGRRSKKDFEPDELRRLETLIFVAGCLDRAEQEAA